MVLGFPASGVLSAVFSLCLHPEVNAQQDQIGAVMEQVAREESGLSE